MNEAAYVEWELMEGATASSLAIFEQYEPLADRIDDGDYEMDNLYLVPC